MHVLVGVIQQASIVSHVGASGDLGFCKFTIMWFYPLVIFQAVLYCIVSLSTVLPDVESVFKVYGMYVCQQ